MILDDQEFSNLFSEECPWLTDCKDIRSLYIYGPRGSGKSSVLRWLSLKTYMSGNKRDFLNLLEIGIYISCSVELRSRFWLLNDDMIEKMSSEIIKFFNCLLLEELFDTLSKMKDIQDQKEFDFGFVNEKLTNFTVWVLKRIDSPYDHLRLEGQSHFSYLRTVVRKLKWETWSQIQNSNISNLNPDPSIINDVCKEIRNHFDYFNNRIITFLIDDYSNQRIPSLLQKKLNSTISFAKQGMPIFKVSSEYNGVDLEGIDRSREVTEINIGEKYTSIARTDTTFIENILNIRLQNTKDKFTSSILDLLGKSKYGAEEMATAIANESKPDGEKFYYHGIDCLHWICSGDIALALELIRKIFEMGKVKPETNVKVIEQTQHNAIQQFSHEEVNRLRYIVPDGDKIYNIVCELGLLAHTIVRIKTTGKVDRPTGAVCKTHLDIKNEAISKLVEFKELYKIFQVLASKAILFSLSKSRSLRSGTTERFQIRRIYLPAFKAPLKRDEPIRIDSIEELQSLLNDPYAFCKRELKKSDIDDNELDFSIEASDIKPTI